MNEKNDFPDDGIIRPMADSPALPARVLTGTKPPPLPASAQSSLSDNASISGSEGALPVGWLVVIAGPGRGRSLPLVSGMNSLGRGAENQLVLDFGDPEIAAKAHAFVTYDPLGKTFYLQPGHESARLTYLLENDAPRPILVPTELPANAIIAVGQTRLRFAPFCGAAFSW